MSMDCERAREEILEMFDGEGSVDVGAHLASCKACAEFAARQWALDRELGELFETPALSPGFRATLRQRIRKEVPRQWPEALPDLVHLTTCGAATLVCAAALPIDAGAVVGVGAVITVATYLLTLMLRSWLDA